MKIGVLSDTHATSLAGIPEETLAALADVDLIIHCGDFTSSGVLDGLRQIGQVVAVHGNMDPLALKNSLPEKEVVPAAGHRLGITHGWGAPDGIEHRVRSLFLDVAAIIFGHSHQPMNRVIDGTLFFNPGCARDSFGILNVGEQIKGEIVTLKR